MGDGLPVAGGGNVLSAYPEVMGAGLVDGSCGDGVGGGEVAFAAAESYRISGVVFGEGDGGAPVFKIVSEVVGAIYGINGPAGAAFP